MKILGIHDGYNASVALVENGVLTFALQEERPTGVKNFFGFPNQSLKILLKERGLTPEKIDRVVFGANFMSEPAPMSSVLKHFGRQGRGFSNIGYAIGQIPLVRKKREALSMNRRHQSLQHYGFNPEQVECVDHHTAHACAAYYGLAKGAPQKYLVVTLGGGGDWNCATVSVAESGQLKRIAATPYGNSLNDLYSRTTFMLGFTPWEQEYKLMGLASYVGEAYLEKTLKIYEQYLDLDPANPLLLKRKIKEPTHHMLPRLERDLARMRFDWIAAGLQRFTENLLSKWIKAAIAQTGVSDVLAGGALFRNIKANKVVSELPEVTSFQVFPSCGDESNSIGAAWHKANELKEKVQPLKHFYLGPTIEESSIKAALNKLDPQETLRVTPLAHPAERIAELLAEGTVVGYVHGPMEFGTRALGNRSLLADPKNPHVVHHINSGIKSRDFWLSFSPLMLAKNAPRYIKNPKQLTSPYMMMSFDSTELGHEYSAALHPFDASSHPQLLEDAQNPALERVLKSFEKRTGRGVLLNTSFNINGDPIVYNAEAAIKTLLNSGLTHLVLNTTLITKEANQKQLQPH